MSSRNLYNFDNSFNWVRNSANFFDDSIAIV